MRLAAATLALLAAAPAAARDHAADAGGPAVAEKRDVPAFTAVRLEGSLDVSVRVGQPPSVVVNATKAAAPHVVTRVEGDTLVLRLDECDHGLFGRHHDGFDGALVEVAMPELRQLDLRGSGDVEIEGSRGGDVALGVQGSGDLRWTGEARTLTASVAGSGDITLSGRAEQLVASVAGSGGVEARKLAARSADARTAGSGDITVTVAGGTLRAATQGSGDVRWWGDATAERVSTAGSGEIVREGSAR